MYVKLIDGVPKPYTMGELLNDNPNVSFPVDLTEETLADWDVYPCARPQKPLYDSTVSYLVDGEFEQDENGNWILNYKVVEFSLEDAKSRVRAKRYSLLKDTDWRFRSDMTPSQAWIDYCQALRDIPQQEGFPYNVSWPEIPLE